MITDIPTGRKVRLYVDDITGKRKYMDEQTGVWVNMAYVNGLNSPVFIRTEDGQQLTVEGQHGVNDSLKVTHIKYYPEDRFRKL